MLRSGCIAIVASLPLVTGLLATSATARTGATIRLVSIEAKLLYERTGKLSKNILPPAKFEGHNTLIGEGDAEEPANDILVTIGLAVDADEATSTAPLVIKVTGNGKTLAQRSLTSILLTKGHAYRSMLVPDATCAGTLVVEAMLGAQKKTAKVVLACGE